MLQNCGELSSGESGQDWGFGVVGLDQSSMEEKSGDDFDVGFYQK